MPVPARREPSKHMHALFTDDFKPEPYWWDVAPRPVTQPGDLPGEVDVLVVGAGYTGLSAALVLARAGRSVLVVERDDVGSGCSSRNGGQIGGGVKPDLAALVRRYGRPGAEAILNEGMQALRWVGDFINAEGIECDYRVCGRFIGAHRASRYDQLARDFESTRGITALEWHMVPKAEMHTEIGTGAYFGGAILPQHASVQPAQFVDGMYQRVLGAGAQVAAHTEVTGIVRDTLASVVTTSRGVVRARDVVIATNGYTGPITAGIRRRLIPIGSYMIATEPLPDEVISRLMPRERVTSDTRKVVYYYRRSPDGRRIVFGGRVACKETDPRISGPRLHKVVVDLFPELAGTRISHSWMGFVAYTFDHLPHIGERDGVWYSAGYCGSGVAWATYMGYRLGHKVLGADEGRTAFDAIRFPTRPLYTGNPWFLDAAVAWYRAMDRFGP